MVQEGLLFCKLYVKSPKTVACKGKKDIYIYIYIYMLQRTATKNVSDIGASIFTVNTLHGYYLFEPSIALAHKCFHANST